MDELWATAVAGIGIPEAHFWTLTPRLVQRLARTKLFLLSRSA